ncbi:hypothetical protein V6N11_059714 [Hibiscus sabdariffa]|uniref:dolichyl-P-Man:Man5GlcNAc2-PP-dolichol alpha-1,3-mannosyltransferase n=1 Tax=Hibiscus sabdariffa TaxID=183260 RepID=A0ABR2NXU5_9ROSI
MAAENSASAHGKHSRRKAAASSSLIPKLMKYPIATMALALLIIDSSIVSFIIAYVPYTKIDWDAYMSQLPWWALSLLCLSKRVHSIFVLRLFNDCFAMTFLHAAMASILFGWWHFGLIIFSAAVSIKMNVLLFAPSLFILMLKAMNISGVISALAGAALVQTISDPSSGLNSGLSVQRAYFLRSGAVLECVSIKFGFISSTPLSPLTCPVGLMVFYARKSLCEHEIGELEQSINDLKTEMGVDGSSSPLDPSKQKSDEAKQDEGSA